MNDVEEGKVWDNGAVLVDDYETPFLYIDGGRKGCRFANCRFEGPNLIHPNKSAYRTLFMNSIGVIKEAKGTEVCMRHSIERHFLSALDRRPLEINEDISLI